ncbi:MAG: hypothetical protein ACRC67_11565 [Inquilinus sp.]|uniref:hypothetical protein n=1 Tax=Inquilinus sp. TaxID=1932117 RepID=UPI003F411A4C
MKTLWAALFLASGVLLIGCKPAGEAQAPPGVATAYRSEIELGRTLEIRPRRLSTGGDIGNNSCIRGSYTHRYQATDGDVWLCCIPPNEILSSSFNCSGSVISILFPDSDDMKIRYCSLSHPTSTEPKFIPVCVPAPLEAPGLDEPT